MKLEMLIPGAIWSQSLDMGARRHSMLVRLAIVSTPRNPAAGKCHVTLDKTDLQAECRRSRRKNDAKAKCIRIYAHDTTFSLQAGLQEMQQVASDIDHASACTVLTHRRT